MTLQLICSKTITEKLIKLCNAGDIGTTNDTDKADFIMCERGLPQPEGKICITFDAIDYMESFELVKNYRASNDQSVLTDTITGFANNRYSVIGIVDIHYIEASGSEVTCYTSNSDFQLKNTLYHYEQDLLSYGIIRINKSQLVNILMVEEIVPWFNARLVLKMKDEREFEVSKHYAKSLKKTLDL